MARDINKLKDRLHAVKGLDSASAYNAQDEEEKRKKQAAQLKSDAQAKAVREALEKTRVSASTPKYTTYEAPLKQSVEVQTQSARDNASKKNKEQATSGKSVTQSRKDQTTSLLANIGEALKANRSAGSDLQRQVSDLRGLTAGAANTAAKTGGWANEAAATGNELMQRWYESAGRQLTGAAASAQQRVNEMLSPASRQQEAELETTYSKLLDYWGGKAFGSGAKKATAADIETGQTENDRLIAEAEARYAGLVGDKSREEALADLVRKRDNQAILEDHGLPNNRAVLDKDIEFLETYDTLMGAYGSAAEKYDAGDITIYENDLEEAQAGLKEASTGYAQAKQNVDFMARESQRKIQEISGRQTVPVVLDRMQQTGASVEDYEAEREALYQDYMNAGSLKTVFKDYDLLNYTPEQYAAYRWTEENEPEKLDDLKEYLDISANAQISQDAQEYWSDPDRADGMNNIFGNTVLGITGRLSGLLNTADIALQSLAVAGGMRNSIDYNRTGWGVQGGEDAVSAQAEKLAEIGSLGDAFDSLKDTWLGDLNLGDIYRNGVDSAVSILNGGLFGKMTGLATSGQVFSGAYADAKERGASDDQAGLFAVFNSAAEGLGEQVSFGSFQNLIIGRGMDKKVGGKILLGLAQMAEEGGQEFVTEELNILADRFVMQELSQEEQQAQAYMAQGYDPDTARELAREENNERLLDAALGGIIGGAMRSGGGYAAQGISNAAGSVQTAIDDAARGRQIQKMGNAQQMAQLMGEVTGETVTPETSKRKLGKQQREFIENAGEYVSGADEATRDIVRGKVYDVANASAQTLDGTSQAAKEKADKRSAAMKTSETGASVGGESVTVQGFVKTAEKGSDAKLNIKKADGTLAEANMEDVTFDSKTAEVYSYAADMATPELANDFRMRIQADQMGSIERVANGYSQAYDMARAGFKEASVRASSLTGALTDEQVSAAYKLGAEARKSAQIAAITKAAERAKANMGNEWKGGKASFDDSVVVDALDDEQKAQIDMASVITGSMGVNVVFFESAADETGRYTRENGSYNRKTNTIYIDVNAGRYYKGDSPSKTALLRTLSHEVTHAIQRNSPETYGHLRQMVVNALDYKKGASIEDLIDRKMAADSSLTTRDAAMDELVADACERMIEDSDAAQRLTEAHPEAAKTIFQKVGELLKKIGDAIKAAFKGRQLSTEAQLVMKDVERYQQMVDLWTKGVMETAEVSGRESFEVTDNGAVVSPEVAEVMESDDYTAPDKEWYSVRETNAWAEAHRKEYPNDADFEHNLALMQAFDRNVAADSVTRYLVPHGRIPKTAKGPLRNNVEYVYTFDMDTKCERTYQFLAYRDAVQKKIGRQLYEDEARCLIELMRAYGQMIPCTYCYVEGKRMKLAELYMKYLAKNGESVMGTKYSAEQVFDIVEAARTIVSGYLDDRFNVPENYTLDRTLANGSFEGYRDFNMPVSQGEAAQEIYDRYNITDKAAKRVIAGYVAEWVYSRSMDVPMNLVNTDADFRSNSIDEKVLAFHDLAGKAAQGGAKAKGIENYEPYVDQLKNISVEDKRYMVGMGGIRKHSSNDFQIQNVQDYMLFFMDLAADKRGGVEWTGHTYTKNLDYARIFAPTNDRINVSIAMYGDNKSGIRANTQEGVVWEELQNVRKQYKNVGAMAMVTNNDQLSFALNSDWIDMIIPFHASGMKRSLYYDVLAWTDYTSKQSERLYTKGQMIDKLRQKGIKVSSSAKAADVQRMFMGNFDVKTVYNEKTGKRVAPHFFPGETEQHGVTIPGHGNDAQRYFELCEQYGTNPRFFGVKVQDANGNTIDVTEHPAYLKLIKETARTDTPQQPIVAKFDMDYVNKAMKDFKGYANLAEDSYGIVDEFVKEYVGKKRKVGYLTERAQQYQEIRTEMAAEEAEKRAQQRTEMLENINNADAADVSRDDVQFMARDNPDDETKHIKQQISAYANQLNSMEAVFNSKVYDVPNTKNKTVLKKWVLNLFNGKGFVIERQDIGNINVSDANLKESVNYLHDQAEIAAFAALPRVLKRGIQIKQTDNHKYRGYPTITLAAPVVINGVRGNMAATVKETNARRYSTHRIVMPDGSAFVFDIKKDAGSSTARGVAKNGSYASPIDPASDAIIPQPASDFNPDIQKQTRDPHAISDREILANALDNAAQTDDERIRLAAYKEGLAKLNSYQAVLDENKAVIGQLAFKKGRTSEENDRLTRAKNRVKMINEKLDEADRALLKLEAMDPIKAIITREGKKVRDERNAVMRERISDMKQTHENAATRKSIGRKVKRLNDMLINATDQRHIPEEFKYAVKDMLELFTNDTSVFDKDRLERVRTAYAAIEASKTDAASMYDDDIAYEIELLATTIGGRRLAKLNANELQMVRNILDHFAKMVKDANNVFLDGRRASIDALSFEVEEQTSGKQHMENRLTEAKFRKWLTEGQIIPPYFFKNLGGAMGRLGDAILAGEDNYGIEVRAAKARLQELMRKFNHREWANRKNDTLELVTESGDAITLTREQALGLYATHKREVSNKDQNAHHLSEAGIVFRKQVKDLKLFKKTFRNSNAVPISGKDMETVMDWLTKEQMQYADAMVEYISTEMAVLGNETSMQLHGYRKFSEGFYYPYKVASDFLKSDFSKTEDALIKNMGFTKRTQRGASNPLVVTDFTKTVADHVNRMLLYHNFAVPQDSFMRVYDHHISKSKTVKSALDTAYGNRIGGYINQFMKDMYGGVVRDNTEDIANQWLGKFKKAKVMASLSVAVQQPSSIGRAFALVNVKYFRPVHAKGAFDEAMQYAGTAVIKSIGRFDTNTGSNVVDWMTREGFDGVMDFVDTAGGFLPEQMDKISWGTIWDAVKREQADKTGLDIDSEELKKIAGKRFNEVIRFTQVYDSTLVRSQTMRSKSVWTKMATSFMSEATVTYNMVYDALQNITKEPRKATATFAAVAGSIIANALLKSIVTAARDDDDEEATYKELYIKNFMADLINGFAPMTYVPLASDIWSIAQGFTVERTDLEVFNLAKEFADIMQNENASTEKKIRTAASFISMVSGIPISNVWREVDAIKNTITAVQNTERPAWFETAIKRGLSDGVILSYFFDDSKAANVDKLYKEARTGSKDAAETREHLILYNNVKDDKAVDSLLRTRIKEGFTAGEIGVDEAIELMTGYAGMKQDDASDKVLEWQYAIDNDGSSYNDMRARYLEGEISYDDAVSDRVQYGGIEEDKAKATVDKWEFERLNGYAYEDLREEHADGNVSSEEAMEIMQDYGGKNENEAYWEVTEWDYGDGWDGKGTLLNDAFAAGSDAQVRSRMQELAGHSDWQKPGNELASYVTDFYKPIYEAAPEAQKDALRQTILGYLKMAYEVVGEEYYGDDYALRYRSWLK